MSGNKLGLIKTNTVTATTALDSLSGTWAEDTFVFAYTDNKNPADDTLNSFDSIANYEYGEAIRIDGILLGKKNIDHSIDQQTKTLTLEIDTDNDGAADTFLTVEDITRATVISNFNKKTNSTEIIIYDDPIELGDGDEIFVIDERAEDAFEYKEKAMALFEAKEDGGELMIQPDYDVIF